MLKVVFIGLEFSGKMILMLVLVKYFDVFFLLEYFRVFLDKLIRFYVEEDLVFIVKG